MRLSDGKITNYDTPAIALPVFDWECDWGSPNTESYEYRTSIHTSEFGTERRRASRDFWRASHTLNYVDWGDSRQRLTEFVQQVLGDRLYWVVPQTATRYTGGKVSGSSFQISVANPTGEGWFPWLMKEWDRGYRNCLLVSDKVCYVAALGAPFSSSAGVMTYSVFPPDGTPINSLPASGTVYFLSNGAITPDGLTIQNITDLAARFTLLFKQYALMPIRHFMPADFGFTEGALSGFNVWPFQQFPTNWRENVGTGIARAIDVNDYELGQWGTRARGLYSNITSDITLTFFNRWQKECFKEFFNVNKGRAGSFWFPSPDTDFTILKFNLSQMLVAGQHNYLLATSNALNAANLFISYQGRSYLAQVLSASLEGQNTIIQLNVITSWATDSRWFANSARYLRLSRFASDAIDIQLLTDDKAECKLKIQSFIPPNGIPLKAVP